MNEKINVVVPAETRDEKRVGLTPDNIRELIKGNKNINVRVESGAGLNAGFTDKQYQAAGAKIVFRTNKNERNLEGLFNEADYIAHVKRAKPDSGEEKRETQTIRKVARGAVQISFHEPAKDGKPTPHMKLYQDAGMTVFALDHPSKQAAKYGMNPLPYMSKVAGDVVIYDGIRRANGDSSDEQKLSEEDIAEYGKGKNIIIFGAKGNAGLEAVRRANKFGMNVIAYDVGKSEELSNEIKQNKNNRLILLDRTRDEKDIQEKIKSDGYMKDADFIVGAADLSHRKAPVFVSDMAIMNGFVKKGCIMSSIPYGNGTNFEGCPVDGQKNRNGVILCNVTGYPKYDAKTASQKYGQALVKIINSAIEKEVHIKSKAIKNPPLYVDAQKKAGLGEILGHCCATFAGSLNSAMYREKAVSNDNQPSKEVNNSQSQNIQAGKILSRL